VRNIIIIFIAIVGLCLTGLMIYHNPKTVTYVELLPTPPSPPFEHFIAGQGLIESAYKNISIGSAFADIITEIYVFPGDLVKKGANLFKTDTRHLQAQLQEARADQAVAQADYNNQAQQFSYYEQLLNKNAVSKLVYTNAEYNKKMAYQRLEKAKATVQLYETDIQRSYVQAPIDGQVLQVNIRVGQYAYPVLDNNAPLILFGDPDYFHVRVDIDEEDAWRYEPDQAGFAYVRGNKSIEIPLEYVYIEPYIIPKKSLSGSDTERVDTRVFQAVYRFKKHDLPVFLGQLLDVYLLAQPHAVNA